MKLKSGLIILSLCFLTLMGCGKKGDPIAPSHGSITIEKSINS